MRLFIAVPLPTEIADRAAACLPLALPAVRPVRADLMHLTLAFLGQVTDDRLAAAIAAAQAGADGHRAFDLSLDHAGTFLRAGRPRAVWLGAGAGIDELTGLAAGVTRALADRSFSLEDRPFSAHLTLARVRPDASAAESRTIARSVERLIVPELCIRVDQIAVVESRLSPKGPRYATRFDIRLGQPEV